MARRGKRAVFAPGVVRRAECVVDTLTYQSLVLQALSVLMTAKLKLTGEQVGMILGVSPATVVRMNRRFRAGADGTANEWGGRRHEALSREDEAEVLAGLAEGAARGEVIGAKQVKAALEERRGGPVCLQTAYNCLARAKWRKVVPSKVHPKQEKEAQEEFKKGASRRRWKWLPPNLLASAYP
jgi:transposase